MDSPGGSYVASDAIRREVLALRGSERPVIASMATVAASGGYYIAMPCDVVVAGATTITGSIGVVAGKQVVKDALGRAGLRVDSESVGAHAEMFSAQRPFTDEEWSGSRRGWIRSTRTSPTRRDRSPDAGDSPRRRAAGSTGATLAHGLVDRIGGLEDAVGIACERAGLGRDDVNVRALPHVGVVRRLRPPESSERPAAAHAGPGGQSLLAGALPRSACTRRGRSHTARQLGALVTHACLRTVDPW